MTFTRPTGDATWEVVHDHTRAEHDPGSGYAFDGVRSWLRRPTSRTSTPGVFLAGAQLRGGNRPAEVVLSGALAAAACAEFLSAADRPPR